MLIQGPRLLSFVPLKSFSALEFSMFRGQINKEKAETTHSSLKNLKTIVAYIICAIFHRWDLSTEPNLHAEKELRNLSHDCESSPHGQLYSTEEEARMLTISGIISYSVIYFLLFNTSVDFSLKFYVINTLFYSSMSKIV